jgi:hypothetical protein
MMKPDPQQTYAKILAYVEFIKLHLLKEPSVNRRESKVVSLWTPPSLWPPGVFLVNVDTTIFEDAGKMGAGMVVRNHVVTCVVVDRRHMPSVVPP